MGKCYLKKGGFTLVELSIVLVIIGLLIGGILAAQSMITTARVNSKVRQLQQYEVAISNFYENYKQLPGNSSLFNPPTDGDIAVNTLTCGGLFGGFRYDRAWAHLSQSGFIKDQYAPWISVPCGGTSTYDSTYVSTAAGISFPLFSKSPKVGLRFGYIPSDSGEFDTESNAAGISPNELLSLDSKLDNGDPTNGNMVSVDIQNVTECKTSSTQCVLYYYPATGTDIFRGNVNHYTSSYYLA